MANKTFNIILGTVLLLLASVSVALYYNITFFGKAVVALPSFPVASGCLFYYLAAFNTTPPVAQVVLWMVSFLLSGWLWWWMLSYIWSHQRVAGTTFPPSAHRRLLGAFLPYLLPLPWLLWVHAQSATGPSIDALCASILVRDGLYWSSQGSETVLNSLFLVLALTETVITLTALRQTGEVPVSKVLVTYTLAGMASTLVLCIVAQLAFHLH